MTLRFPALPTVLLAVAILAASVSSAAAITWGTQRWCPKYSGEILQSTGRVAADLQEDIAEYRRRLGGIDNGNNPGQTSGHRSINWDAAVVPFNMPGDFFRNNVTRGAEFLAVEGRFAVSNPPPADAPSDVRDNRFSSFNSKFAWLFRTFSPKRLFTPVKSNQVRILFSVPQSNRAAHVSGFAAVFTNVVLRGETLMHFYDANECLILRLPIIPQRRGLSFSGIIVKGRNGQRIDVATIASVKITLGNAIISEPINHKARRKNVVVLDDLIYGEPQPIDH